MIDWKQIVKDNGFVIEDQMWTVLITSLRNNDAISKHLGVSRGSVQRRRLVMGCNKPAKRGPAYRKSEKRNILNSLPEEAWNWPLEDVQLFIKEKYEEDISLAYISKIKRERGS